MILNQLEGAIIAQSLSSPRAKQAVANGETKASEKVRWGAAVRQRQCWEWSPGLLTPSYMGSVLPTQLIPVQTDCDAYIAV